MGNIDNINLKKAVKIHKWVLKNVEYVSDIENYGEKEGWATSNEALERMRDDCDGQVVVIWKKLDNGYLSYQVKKASELFPFLKKGVVIEPLFGFNLFSQWKYEAKTFK